MASNHVGEMFNGKLGRPAQGMGYGLLVGIVEDSVAAGLRVSNGSFGWDGACGTQMWIDPREKMVTDPNPGSVHATRLRERRNAGDCGVGARTRRRDRRNPD